MRIDNDIFLSDHTVAKNDPRILETLKSSDRIRSRTGFDPILIKNKMWAKKVSKDLAQGLSRVDGISEEKRRRELSFVRNIESEKYLMNRKLDQMSKNLVRTGRGRNNAENDGYSRMCLRTAYCALHRSVNNLKEYTAELETQGGFFKRSSEDVDLEEKTMGSNEVISEIEPLPQLHHIELDEPNEPKIFCVHRHLITQTSGKGRFYKIRSPSLPTIQVKNSAFKSRNSSFPDDLAFFLGDEN